MTISSLDYGISLSQKPFYRCYERASNYTVITETRDAGAHAGLAVSIKVAH